MIFSTLEQVTTQLPSQTKTNSWPGSTKYQLVKNFLFSTPVSSIRSKLIYRASHFLIFRKRKKNKPKSSSKKTILSSTKLNSKWKLPNLLQRNSFSSFSKSSMVSSSSNPKQFRMSSVASISQPLQRVDRLLQSFSWTLSCWSRTQETWAS